MAALERLNPEYPGIVISDVKLPQMDGLQFLERLRAIDPDLPVVLITGHGDIAMAVDAMRRGAYDFIEKRSEEHTSELQSLMRISYAVFCLKTKTKKTNITYTILAQTTPQ